jgi:hypothetical protein
MPPWLSNSGDHTGSALRGDFVYRFNLTSWELAGCLRRGQHNRIGDSIAGYDPVGRGVDLILLSVITEIASTATTRIVCSRITVVAPPPDTDTADFDRSTTAADFVNALVRFVSAENGKRIMRNSGENT